MSCISRDFLIILEMTFRNKVSWWQALVFLIIYEHSTNLFQTRVSKRHLEKVFRQKGYSSVWWVSDILTLVFNRSLTKLSFFFWVNKSYNLECMHNRVENRNSPIYSSIFSIYTKSISNNCGKTLFTKILLKKVTRASDIHFIKIS